MTMHTYEIEYNRGYDTPVCAMTYVQAKTYDEAYALANAKRVGRERVYMINVVKPGSRL
jgi:hypothetical protein